MSVLKTQLQRAQKILSEQCQTNSEAIQEAEQVLVSLRARTTLQEGNAAKLGRLASRLDVLQVDQQPLASLISELDALTKTVGDDVPLQRLLEPPQPSRLFAASGSPTLFSSSQAIWWCDWGPLSPAPLASLHVNRAFLNDGHIHTIGATGAYLFLGVCTEGSEPLPAPIMSGGDEYGDGQIDTGEKQFFCPRGTQANMFLFSSLSPTKTAPAMYWAIGEQIDVVVDPETGVLSLTSKHAGTQHLQLPTGPPSVNYRVIVFLCACSVTFL